MLHVQRPPREWASSRDCFWLFLSCCCFYCLLAPLYLLYWVYYHCQVATSLEQQLNTTPRAVRTTNNPRLLVLFFFFSNNNNNKTAASSFLSFFFLEASRVLSFAHLLLRLEKEMSSHFICTCHQNLFWNDWGLVRSRDRFGRLLQLGIMRNIQTAVIKVCFVSFFFSLSVSDLLFYFISYFFILCLCLLFIRANTGNNSTSVPCCCAVHSGRLLRDQMPLKLEFD